MLRLPASTSSEALLLRLEPLRLVPDVPCSALALAPFLGSLLPLSHTARGARSRRCSRRLSLTRS